jgi:hypothetical protein
MAGFQVLPRFAYGELKVRGRIGFAERFAV